MLDCTGQAVLTGRFQGHLTGKISRQDTRGGASLLGHLTKHFVYLHVLDEPCSQPFPCLDHNPVLLNLTDTSNSGEAHNRLPHLMQKDITTQLHGGNNAADPSDVSEVASWDLGTTHGT